MNVAKAAAIFIILIMDGIKRCCNLYYLCNVSDENF